MNRLMTNQLGIIIFNHWMRWDRLWYTSWFCSQALLVACLLHVYCLVFPIYCMQHRQINLAILTNILSNSKISQINVSKFRPIYIKIGTKKFGNLYKHIWQFGQICRFDRGEFRKKQFFTDFWAPFPQWKGAQTKWSGGEKSLPMDCTKQAWLHKAFRLHKFKSFGQSGFLETINSSSFYSFCNNLSVSI